MVSPMELNKRTIPILIALLEIRIVAKSFFGRSNKLTTIFPLAVFFSSISFKSVWDKPKKATSAPEIRPEKIKSTNSITIFNAKVPLITIKFENKLRGSGSNSQNLLYLFKMVNHHPVPALLQAVLPWWNLFGLLRNLVESLEYWRKH